MLVLKYFPHDEHVRSNSVGHVPNLDSVTSRIPDAESTALSKRGIPPRERRFFSVVNSSLSRWTYSWYDDHWNCWRLMQYL